MFRADIVMFKMRTGGDFTGTFCDFNACTWVNDQDQSPSVTSI